MGFNLGGFGGAGGGANMLQQILAQAFKEQAERKRAKQEDERISIDKQRANSDDELRRMAMEDRRAAQADAAELRAVTGAQKITESLAPETTLDAGTKSALIAGKLGPLVRHDGADLKSTAISGTAQAGPDAPIMGRLMLADAGRPERDTYTGTAEQRRGVEQQESRRRMAATTTDPRTRDFLNAEDAGVKLPTELLRDRDAERQATLEDKEHMLRLAASLRPPAQPHARYNVVQGSDKDGKAALIRTNVDTGQVEVLPMPEGANFAKREQPATQDQSNLALFANRVEQADPILERLTPVITKMNPAVFAGHQWLDQPVLQDKNMQQYQQAARNLINAVLRRESGAAISASEFAEARKQYLPVPGDDAATLAQKAETRRIVRENYKRSAGPAYKPMSAPPNGGSGFKVVEIK